MSKYLIKLGRNNKPKVFDLVPEESCIFYSIISEYYDRNNDSEFIREGDSGYIIKIPDFKIEDIKKFMKRAKIDDIEDGVFKFFLYHVTSLEEEKCLGAYDDLMEYFVNLIKNS